MHGIGTKVNKLSSKSKSSILTELLGGRPHSWAPKNVFCVFKKQGYLLHF
jgi:hypothetical protein